MIGSAAVAVVIGLIATSIGGGDGDKTSSSAPATSTGPGEIFREPQKEPGPGPYTPSVAKDIPVAATSTTGSSTTAASTTSSGGPTAVPTYAGGTPGLYGGTLNQTTCDTAQLVTFLEQNPDKAAAWASVEGIEPSQIRAYVEKLTPVFLQADTRVTNHGFNNGKPVPRQAVLQAGSAVLVDQFGVPRVRCYCGNPLKEPIAQQTSTTYTGPSWPAFDAGKVQAVTPETKPVDTFVLRDPTTGAGVARPAGANVTSDKAVAAPPPLPAPGGQPAATTTTTSTTTTTAPATTTSTLPRPPADKGIPVNRPQAFASDLTPAGAVLASSTDPNFPANLTSDLDTSTSWFSQGTRFGPVAKFTWTAGRVVNIDAIVIGGNRDNGTVAFRRNYGFASVKIEVFDGGQLTHTSQYALDGTPDPTIRASIKAVGDIVVLSFTGHESPDCGGFGELLVLGPGWENDVQLAQLNDGIRRLFA
jgi:hypothetical protein